MLTARKLKAAPVKARAPELACDVSTIFAFKIIAATLLAQIQANRLGVIAGRDPEYLHQMRVAVRRLRAVCGLYAKVLPTQALEPLITELKWFARALGPARDADVFVTEIWPPLREALRENSLCQLLDARWAAQRHTTAAKLHHTLGAPRYQRLIHDCGQWLAVDAGRAGASQRQHAELRGAAREFAGKALKRRNARLRGYGRSLKQLDDAQLHALRIQVKKLRYATDSFAPLFARKAVQELLARLSHLQNVLGQINDLRVAQQQVMAALAGRRGGAAAELRETLASWQQSRATALRDKLYAAWRGYRRSGTPW
jgi:CHAD domain-containing protein